MRQGKSVERIGYGRERKRMLSKRRKARRWRKIQRLCALLLALWALLVVLPSAARALLQFGGLSPEDYPQELLELLEKNEETYDFVSGYPERADFMGKEIDLSKDYEPGNVPLLMQWDRRWGYDSYGDDMIGLAGCGPTCMAMAYLYLTGDVSMNPRAMAEYADSQGYDTEAGTSWSFFTEGAAGLGLFGSELPLSEGAMQDALDQGKVVVCSMGPGDFTTSGHFILLRGYDGNGFYVNDPNRRANSGKQWDYDTLSSQIKCLWCIGK